MPSQLGVTRLLPSSLLGIGDPFAAGEWDEERLPAPSDCRGEFGVFSIVSSEVSTRLGDCCPAWARHALRNKEKVTIRKKFFIFLPHWYFFLFKSIGKIAQVTGRITLFRLPTLFFPQKQIEVCKLPCGRIRPGSVEDRAEIG